MCYICMTYVLHISIWYIQSPGTRIQWSNRDQDTLESTEPKRQKHFARFHCVTKNFLSAEVTAESQAAPQGGFKRGQNVAMYVGR